MTHMLQGTGLHWDAKESVPSHHIPPTIDAILDELYREHQERINRATDREIEVVCRSAVERISDRPAKDARFDRRAAA